MLASAGDDGTVRLWTVEGRLIRTLPTSVSSIWSLGFSPDGQRLIIGGTAGWVQVLSLTGEPLDQLRTPAPITGIRTVAYSPQGDLIAAGGNDNTLTLWQADGQRIATLTGHQAPVFAIAISPDGELIASGSLDKTIRLWRSDGTLVKILYHHSAPVQSLAFSPDGQTLVSASWDKTLALWSRSGTLLGTLKGHDAAVWGWPLRPMAKPLPPPGPIIPCCCGSAKAHFRTEFRA